MRMNVDHSSNQFASWQPDKAGEHWTNDAAEFLKIKGFMKEYKIN